MPFGPRIQLTSYHVANVVKMCNDAGLQATVEQCDTGSVYVEVFETVRETNIHGEEYDDCGDSVAKIRLSGHEEGARHDATHNCVGSQSLCLETLWRWLGEIITVNVAF
jgi:hypothetical protein